MVYNTLKTLSFSLFPPTCVLCGAIGESELDLCAACHQELPIIDDACFRCGVPLNLNGPVELDSIFCGRCLQKPPQFDRVIAPLYYENPVDWMVQQLKYRAYLAHVRVLGQILVDYLDDALIDLPEIIIPVPLHHRRLRERGFNQALELARPLAEKFNMPIIDNICSRQKDTPQQSVLTANERVSNLRNAFLMRGPLPVKSVAIVDDVVTTGATVNALAKLLKQNGAERVQVWAVARTVSN